MKKRLCAGALLAAFTVFLCLQPAAVAQKDMPAGTVDTARARPSSVQSGYMRCDFYDEALFLENIRTAPAYPDLADVTGATVPHYAPMMSLTAGVLSAVSAQRTVETVVILAPNHSGEGAAVQLSGDGFYWESGSIAGSPDARLFSANSALRAAVTNTHIAADHSAATLAPYIAHYLPEAQLVTLLLSSAASDIQLTAIADTLTALAAEKDILVLCSIDFSHYQTPQRAEHNDRQTRDAMSFGREALLRSFDGAYLDCPEALVTLMRFAARRDAVLNETDYRLVTYAEQGLPAAASYFIYTVC